MEVQEAKRLREKMEENLKHEFEKYEEQSGLEIAGVFIERLDIRVMGNEKKKTIIGDVEVVIGVDLPPTPKGGMQI